jgi:biopolymer transport protein ExbD
MKALLALSALAFFPASVRAENPEATDLAAPAAKPEACVAKLDIAAAPAAKPDAPRAIAFRILADGTFQLDGASATDQEAAAKLRRIFENEPSSLIRISGADGVRYRRVVEAIDLASRCGINRISFKTDSPVPQPSQPPTP